MHREGPLGASKPNIEQASTPRSHRRKAMKKRFFTLFFSHMKISCQGEGLKILSLISE